MRISTTSFLIFFIFFGTYSLLGQTSQVEFGKNRVQFHEDFKEWSMYESENFITYWYGEGRNIGQAVVQIAETDYRDIQAILEHRMNDKIDIIVYKDLTDLKQTNIGNEEVFFNTGGKTKIIGSKIFVYFDGDHNNLRRSVREGVASAYLNAMLFGANLQEIVQNAVLLNLPEWFKEGLVSYAGETWNVEYDNELRQIFLENQFKDFDEFAREYPKLAGHSMWYFISQNYGKSIVPNLLYLTRINRSIESGFAYVLGYSYDETLQNWKDFYTKRYEKEIKGLETPGGKNIEIKNKRKLPISNLKISPNGKKIAYALNEIGKVKVYVQDIHTGKRTRILKYSHRNPFQETDYNYPLLSWSPNNAELGVIYEKRDVIQLLLYDIHTEKKVEDVMPNMYQRIHSMDYVNPYEMVFSATAGGFSDIYMFYVKNRQSKRITHDFWDDLDARFVKLDNRKGILFASNRTDSLMIQANLDSILPVRNFDLFYYDLTEPSNELTQVTKTPFANERHPVGIDTTWFTYLSDASGIINQSNGYLETYLAWNNQAIYFNDGTEVIIHQDSVLNNLDSTKVHSIVIQPVYKKRGITHPSSNYSSNILLLDIAPKKNRQVVIYKEDEKYLVTRQTVHPDTLIIPKTTTFREQSFTNSGLIFKQPNLSYNPRFPQNNPNKKDPSSVKTNEPIPSGYLFQSEFDDPRKSPTTTTPKEESTPANVGTIPAIGLTTSSEVHDFKRHRIVPYRLQFRTDFITTTIDNSLLFGGLNTYAGTGQDYDYPPPGILFKANFKDLFEDYVLEGGVRVPTTFNGAEFYMFLDDKKKRIDKRFAVYRRSRRRTLPRGNRFVDPKSRETTFLTQLELRYPLDIFTSIRATSTLRLDKQTRLATDQPALNTETAKQQRFGIKLEYVFDNTMDIDINIKNGTRYKFYGEVLKKFEIDFVNGFNFDLAEGFMTVVGLDARHYQRLDKHSILALRAAGATSFGSERILFLLGGVDNWLFPGFNSDIDIPAREGLAYQTFANNMRGFRSNIRNGTSYGLVNAELRVPIFKYFSRRKLRSSFFRSFQLVGFVDAGTAWLGSSPWSDDNPLNTDVVSNPVVSVTVNYFRDPIVIGYGGGIRAMLFGYFLKLDYGWGLESGLAQDPILHFSMGKDF